MKLNVGQVLRILIYLEDRIDVDRSLRTRPQSVGKGFVPEVCIGTDRGDGIS